ncbi:MAG: PDZ domain-containing protein, partial [Clostridia bacterium]|nr:PDZ domain-containing protein [Clostridia bacterium]
DHGLSLIDINDLFTAASYRVSSLGVYVYESKYTDDIKNGDRIASINGKEVSTSAGVKEALSGCQVGDKVDVTVVRGGRFVSVELELHEYIPEGSGEVSFG